MNKPKGLTSVQALEVLLEIQRKAWKDGLALNQEHIIDNSLVMASCCSNGSGRDAVFTNGKWHDTDCKTLKPGYVANDELYGGDWMGYAPQDTLPTGPVCECGADRVYGKGSNMHSAIMPCPLYRKP